MGSPGREHQRTSRSTFVGGNHCTSVVELLGNVDGVVVLGQGGLVGVAELVLGEGEVDAEVEPEVDVDAEDAEDTEDAEVCGEVELDEEVAP